MSKLPGPGCRGVYQDWSPGTDETDHRRVMMKNLTTRQFDIEQNAYRSQYQNGFSCGECAYMNGNAVSTLSADIDRYSTGFRDGYRDGLSGDESKFPTSWTERNKK